MTITLNQPLKPNLAKLTKYLEQVNDSGWYTNFGPLHQELSARLESYLGVKNLLLVSNGTLALQVAYKVLNTQSALTTPFSFVATTSSLIWQGVETVFCDIDAKSYNLCPSEVNKALRVDKSIDTVVATHVYGNPCNVKAFSALAEEHNVNVIYDAAHAFGVKIGDKSVLSFGDASTLSFHATKVFHTVEGGAIIFKRAEDFKKAKELINFGMDSSGAISDVGINAKLNEYQCAVGLTLLDNIDMVLEHRSKLFKAYKVGLSGILELPKWHDETNYNGAYFPIYLESKERYDCVTTALKYNEIEFRPYFKPSLDLVFSDVRNNGVGISQKISNHILCLPLHYNMTIDDINTVVNCINLALKDYK